MAGANDSDYESVDSNEEVVNFFRRESPCTLGFQRMCVIESFVRDTRDQSLYCYFCFNVDMFNEANREEMDFFKFGGSHQFMELVDYEMFIKKVCIRCSTNLYMPILRNTCLVCFTPQSPPPPLPPPQGGV